MSETTCRPLKRLGLLNGLDLTAPPPDPSAADAPADHAMAELPRAVRTSSHPSDTTRRTSVYLSAAMLRRLKQLALARECRVNDLLVEAAASILRENGHMLPPTSRDTR